MSCKSSKNPRCPLRFLGLFTQGWRCCLGAREIAKIRIWLADHGHSDSRKRNAGSWWVVFLSVFVGTGVGGWYWQRTLGNEHFRKTGALLTFILQHSPLKCHSITSLKQLNVAVVKKNQWIQTNDAGALKCIHVSQTLRLAMDQRTDLCMWLNAEVTHFPCGHKTKYYKEMHLKLGPFIPAWCSKHFFRKWCRNFVLPFEISSSFAWRPLPRHFPSFSSGNMVWIS